MTVQTHEQVNYRDLVENANDLIQSIAPDGSFLYVNRTWLNVLGYEPEEVERLTLFDILHPESHTHCMELFQRIMAGDSMPFVEASFVTKSGDIIMVEGSVNCKFQNGHPVSTRGIFRNVTDRKLYEEKLKQSAERIKLFAYAVAHDLKSPATALHGLTRLLHNKYGSMFDEKAKNYCHLVLQSSQQLIELVEKINQYIETCEVPLSLEPFSLKDILAMLESEFGERLAGRRIEWQKPDSNPYLVADRISLLRVFRNLIDNALKYGGESMDRLTVGYSETETHHLLSVADNGVGLTLAEPQQIFQRFRRGETAKGSLGAGMGLAIVKEIVEQHGGDVWVESGPFGGASFFFSLLKNPAGRPQPH